MPPSSPRRHTPTPPARRPPLVMPPGFSVLSPAPALPQSSGLHCGGGPWGHHRVRGFFRRGRRFRAGALPGSRGCIFSEDEAVFSGRGGGGVRGKRGVGGARTERRRLQGWVPCPFRNGSCHQLNPPTVSSLLFRLALLTFPAQGARGSSAPRSRFHSSSTGLAFAGDILGGVSQNSLVERGSRRRFPRLQCETLLWLRRWWPSLQNGRRRPGIPGGRAAGLGPPVQRCLLLWARGRFRAVESVDSSGSSPAAMVVPALWMRGDLGCGPLRVFHSGIPGLRGSWVWGREGSRSRGVSFGGPATICTGLRRRSREPRTRLLRMRMCTLRIVAAEVVRHSQTSLRCLGSRLAALAEPPGSNSGPPEAKSVIAGQAPFPWFQGWWVWPFW